MRGEPIEIGRVRRRSGIGQAPPSVGDRAAAGIGDGVPGIAGGGEDVGADEFKKNGPADDVARDFAEGRCGIALANFKPALDQQEGRQCAGNEECVVEPIVEERNMAIRLDEPSIGGIERATQQKERVKDVSKGLHKSARIIKPNPNPNSSFRRKTLLKITNRRIRQAGRMSSNSFGHAQVHDLPDKIIENMAIAHYRSRYYKNWVYPPMVRRHACVRKGFRDFTVRYD